MLSPSYTRTRRWHYNVEFAFLVVEMMVVLCCVFALLRGCSVHFLMMLVVCRAAHMLVSHRFCKWIYGYVRFKVITANSRCYLRHKSDTHSQVVSHFGVGSNKIFCSLRLFSRKEKHERINTTWNKAEEEELFFVWLAYLIGSKNRYEFPAEKMRCKLS